MAINRKKKMQKEETIKSRESTVMRRTRMHQNNSNANNQTGELAEIQETQDRPILRLWGNSPPQNEEQTNNNQIENHNHPVEVQISTNNQHVEEEKTNTKQNETQIVTPTPQNGNEGARQEEQDLDGAKGGGDRMNLGILSDLTKVFSLKFMDIGLLNSYNPSDKSLTFKLNSNFEAIVQANEEILYDSTSHCHMIPHSVFTNNIFPYFNALELFRLRGVSKEWREMISGSWHKAFKREMREQLLGAELCKEIEKQFKLVHMRNPFRNKTAHLLKALTELIQWNELEKAILEDTLSDSLKCVIYTLYQMLGHDKLNIDSVQDMIAIGWRDSQLEIHANLHNYMNKIFQPDFNFDSKIQLKKLKLQFLRQSFFGNQYYASDDQQNGLLLVLFTKLCYLFALIQNYMYIVQHYIQMVKDKLERISKDWPENKRFLEGAYQILILGADQSLSKNKEEEVDDDKNEDDDDEPGLNASSMLKSLFNFNQSNLNDPDFVIQRKGTLTRVFLDRQTQLDIVLSTLFPQGAEAIGKVFELFLSSQAHQNEIDENSKQGNPEAIQINPLDDKMQAPSKEQKLNENETPNPQIADQQASQNDQDNKIENVKDENIQDDGNVD